MKDKTEGSVASPCVRNCCLDKQDMCVGCFRLIDEILIWGQASNQQKTDILHLCEKRKHLTP
ncbi:DUF1289 domain-containing protein [Paraglaciecola sp. 2405UD69-4]|uniref:DUF1289 domain-containing protein n=1 Tax=Paraglaciecola sp. 2405UD69-4 TaxID=3391836 RepID=UPI0039C98C4F